MQAQMLAPAAVLVLWTLVMLMLDGATRLPPLFKQPGGPRRGQAGWARAGSRRRAAGQRQVEIAQLHPPARTADAVLRDGRDPRDHGRARSSMCRLAWAYVALRIVHSLWQATGQPVSVRFALFLISTVCLLVLAVRAPCWHLSRHWEVGA